jgi:uncharacterized protein VirK/YbjX
MGRAVCESHWHGKWWEKAEKMNVAAVLYQTAPAVHPDPTWWDALARVKYWVRGMLRPGLSAEWFALLEAPCLEPLVRQHPHIFSKLQRPYLHRRLGARDRLSTLKEHYRFVTERLDPTVRAEIFKAGGWPLLNFTVPEAGAFSLRLLYDSRYEKEGDLSIALMSESAGMMFILTFCVTRLGPEETSELFIGGLQGHGGSSQRDLVVTLTRGLHGLRPKALLVFAMQELAQIWGFGRLRGVGCNEHVYRHYLKRKDVHASYDDFWKECLGRASEDGNFELPIAPPARNLEELPRNKRPVYRRRYAMLAGFREQMRAKLGVAPQSAVTAEPETDPQWASTVAGMPTQLAFEVA